MRKTRALLTKSYSAWSNFPLPPIQLGLTVETTPKWRMLILIPNNGYKKGARKSIIDIKNTIHWVFIFIFLGGYKLLSSNKIVCELRLFMDKISAMNDIYSYFQKI